MGIDMGDETNMAIAVMYDDELVFCKSFADYSEFNEAVQELQKNIIFQTFKSGTKMTDKKKRGRPLLVVGENNILSGKQLQDMGYRITSGGYLIAATLKYNVWIVPGQWTITLRGSISKPKTNKNVRSTKRI